MSHPYEIWTWEKCSSNIQSLVGRNGFSNTPVIKFLGFEIDTRNGILLDALTEKVIDTSERSGRSVSNTIFYLLSAYSKAENIEPTGKLISSKQFRGAMFIRRDLMSERTIIIREFRKENEKLVATAKTLSGNQIAFPYGDVTIQLDVLPRIPIIIVLSNGDGELPPDARILYDITIEKYFDSEQTYFLTHLTVTRLIQSKNIHQ
jgi:hypothetical protein